VVCPVTKAVEFRFQVGASQRREVPAWDRNHPVRVTGRAAHLLGAAVTLAGRWQGGIIIPMFLVGYCIGRMAESPYERTGRRPRNTLPSVDR
jgi:hypothetical protein